MDKIKIPIPIMMDIVELKKHELNVKEHPESQINNLMNLIKMVGFKDPIVIDRDNIIWAGHGRLEAAFRLAMAQVPIIYLEDLSESQKKLFMYMDNQINESPWVMENVKILLGDVPQIELEQFQVDFNDILGITIEEEQDIPEVPAEPKSRLGEVYQLGNHRVMCGDCTNGDHLKLLLKDIQPNFSCTDPPYNIGYIYNEYKDNKTPDEYLKLCNNFFSMLKSKCERIIMTVGHQNLQLWLDIEKPTHVSPWIKKNATSGCKISMFNVWEPILFYGNFKKFRKRSNDIFEFNNTIQKDIGIHTSPKQVTLIADIIENYSSKDEICLDPFTGSGSTLIACEQTNRICYGMELDPGYVDVIITRWENFTGQKAELVSTHD